MPVKLFMVFACLFLVCTFFEAIMVASESDMTVFKAEDINVWTDSLAVPGAQSDSGVTPGFLFQSTSFLTKLAPKLYSWDFAFLDAWPFEYLRYPLMMLSFATFVLTFGQVAMGAFGGIFGRLLGLGRF